MRHASLLSVVIACLLECQLGAARFGVTNLASNTTDPTLLNAWGIASSATGPFWIGANGSGTSPIYNGNGGKLGLQVIIPGNGSVTGVAFNTLSAGNFNGDLFLFASEDGTISGWRGALGSNAEILVSPDDANVYKGTAQAVVGGNSYVYAANFRTGNVDVFKGSASAPDLTGKFTDPNLPSGFAPFNVVNLGGVLYVTYAKQDSAMKDDVPGPGLGYVDKFDLNGNLIARVVSAGPLNSPWGVAIAPTGWGDLAGALLVGNFGDGMINAFDADGVLISPLLGGDGNPMVIDGLWGLLVGNGGNGGLTNALYFTAGPNDETDGLFGKISLVPEPATLGLSAAGFALALFLRRRAPAGG